MSGGSLFVFLCYLLAGLPSSLSIKFSMLDFDPVTILNEKQNVSIVFASSSKDDSDLSITFKAIPGPDNKYILTTLIQAVININNGVINAHQDLTVLEGDPHVVTGNVLVDFNCTVEPAQLDGCNVTTGPKEIIKETKYVTVAMTTPVVSSDSLSIELASKNRLENDLCLVVSAKDLNGSASDIATSPVTLYRKGSGMFGHVDFTDLPVGDYELSVSYVEHSLDNSLQPWVQLPVPQKVTVAKPKWMEEMEVLRTLVSNITGRLITLSQEVTSLRKCVDAHCLHGNCSRTSKCNCDSGWTGDHCDIDITKCDDCLCNNTDKSKHCDCLPNFIIVSNTTGMKNCKRVVCEAFNVTLTNVMVEPDGQQFVGVVVTFTCPVGMLLKGEANTSVCENDGDNGRWNVTAPKCEAITCPTLTVGDYPDVNEISYNVSDAKHPEKPFGTTATFTCEKTHKHAGSPYLICENDWVGNSSCVQRECNVTKCKTNEECSEETDVCKCKDSFERDNKDTCVAKAVPVPTTKPTEPTTSDETTTPTVAVWPLHTLGYGLAVVIAGIIIAVIVYVAYNYSNKLKDLVCSNKNDGSGVMRGIPLSIRRGVRRGGRYTKLPRNMQEALHQD